jgi:hypothetical protein
MIPANIQRMPLRRPTTSGSPNWTMSGYGSFVASAQPGRFIFSVPFTMVAKSATIAPSTGGEA